MGGLLGLGPGNSLEKNLFLPEPHTDFIFAIIGEELGLWGVLGVLFVFILFFQRGIKIAKQTTDPFGIMLSIELCSVWFCILLLMLAMLLEFYQLQVYLFP